MKYTDEINIQIVLGLLKEHGIMVFTENEIEQLFQKIA